MLIREDQFEELQTDYYTDKTLIMDLVDRLKQLSDRIERMQENVTTEEATKNAFVMPFIQALGYDVFNPLEVVPEYTADLGIKKGEKVDYCILRDGEPCIFIECKAISQKKLDVHKSQLHRYFHVTPARLAILTNGVIYRFYTDLVKDNVMDDKPFLILDLAKFSDVKVNSIKKFTKEHFDINDIVSSASELKYTKEIKDFLEKEFNSPTEAFVKFIMDKVYNGIRTKTAIEQFTPLVAASIKNYVNELVNNRLQRAIDEPQPVETEEVEEVVEVIDNGIETTEEELQGFRIVQAILLREIPAERVSHRDVKSYFGILLDNNNRKPICRLHFNSSTKYIELFDTDKNSRKEVIEELSDIYRYSEELLDVVRSYIGEPVK